MLRLLIELLSQYMVLSRYFNCSRETDGLWVSKKQQLASQCVIVIFKNIWSESQESQ